MHAYSIQRGMSKTHGTLLHYDGHNATVCRSYVPVLAQSPEQQYMYSIAGTYVMGMGCRCGTPYGPAKVHLGRCTPYIECMYRRVCQYRNESTPCAAIFNILSSVRNRSE